MTPELRMLDWPIEDRASLTRFAEAMSEVKSRIQAISGEEGGVPVPRLPRVPTARECARVVLRQRLELRRMVGDHADMLGDPAWEMLLAVFQAEAPMPQAALFEAIGLSGQGRAGPRWVALLVDRGWLVPGDAGLALGAAGRALMERYFASF
ncbi:hypothetical protein ACQKJZ_11860 [Sphingomonas sp. NPDC019816]|uniref:hypothetical protein n=1 Tax=unclassified Sphingomonas TaxID=196159 RepID=UPI0028A1B6F8|nr:hypothetical protein [Sphingomonas sp.]